ncbi:TPA: DNA-binding protein [Klebsiella pneumoniae]|uniref:Rha family transcriptional regulator n=1 Tax=Acinetobacter baumannii TaxID=470 RepID=UPI0002CE11A8|nr:phage antirepressor KilAC domain-containing protein [Acinetobacter baumannii]HBY5034638.1 DNA-binding protein [Klebsiella pneumoniae]ENW40310.1 hypothetical protein F920_03796 [Acinetobacter baumannii NIPH 335]MBU0343072.1 Rha family transcriptional regulator [Acinetobacter baumannii]TPS15182.1 DNA-binding protein [Acinetobacter baumannii]UMN97152.1 Rha family transcriptional regulator [Acinetobacter baumannii]
MNAAVKFQETKSMTSLEIAELVEKRHDNVKRTIESLVNTGVIVQPQIEDGIKSANGVIPKIYVFTGEQGKRDSIIVVAQLCPEFTARLVDRWQELEAQLQETAFKIPQTYAEALMLAAEQARQLEVAAPKVRHYDTVVERTTLLTATQVGQKVKFSAVRLNKVLEELDVYNKTLKRGKAFKQWFVDAGYGIMRQTENGFSQPMFTTKGEAWVVERLISEGIC